jgi:hypothetical protein
MMGPFPLQDDFGMKAVLVVLDRSLDKGKYSDYVQNGKPFAKPGRVLRIFHKQGQAAWGTSWELMSGTYVGSLMFQLIRSGSRDLWLAFTNG